MKRMILLTLLALAVVACGPAQREPSDPTDQVTTEVDPADPDPADPEPVADPEPGDARAELLALLTAHMEMNPGEWPEEMSETMHPGGCDALIGMTRDELVGALGEPTAGEPFTSEGQLAWTIGRLPEEYPAHPPILIVSFDDAGVVTEVVSQHSM